MVEGIAASYSHGRILLMVRDGAQAVLSVVRAHRCESDLRLEHRGKKNVGLGLALMIQISDRLPGTLQTFLRVGWSDKEKESKALSQRLRIYRRYHRLQSVVGWIAIVLAEAFSIPDLIKRAPDNQFEQAVQSLLSIRPRLMDQVESLWPHYPHLLTQVGGIDLFTTP